MLNKPLITVMVPVFNVEKYVYEAISSICNQTYQNLEIIIVDDCSTDSTYDVVNKMSLNDSRIKLYRNSQNLKIADTLNFALSMAKGEYIARMDGDDISEFSKIEKQYSFLINNPEYSLVGTNYILIDEGGNEISRTYFPIKTSKLSKSIQYESPAAHIWLTPKKIYDEIGMYRMPGVEDYDFLLRLISAGHKVANLSEYLYFVRTRNGNTISTMGLKQRKMAEYSFKLYKERISKNSKFDSYNVENFNIHIKCSQQEFNQFQKSSEKYNLFLRYKKKSRIRSCFFLVYSIFLSPKNQLKYINGRLLIKLIQILNFYLSKNNYR